METRQTAPLRWRLTAAALVATLVACGGGGGGTSVPTEPAQAVVQGTAAIGAALVGGEISVIDRTGAQACTNQPVTTDATGSYRCVLDSTSQGPYVVLATDPAGLIAPMISILTVKPAVGSTSTTNVTPLTTAIVAQLAPDNDAFALVSDPSGLAALDLDELEAIASNVVTQLSDVLTGAGIDPATFDPLTTPFVGGSGAGADQMLDQIRVSFDGGEPTLSNVLNPDAPAVPMADATTTAPPAVGTSVLTTPFAISELEFAKTELERCFAVSSVQRAPDPDTAQRRLREVAPECEDFVAAAGDAPNVDIDFRHNGYDAPAYFFDLLTSAQMDGAQFNLPELMRFIPRQDGRDEALLNIKFRTSAGFTDNRILTAKKFPGSRASGTQWWLIGNQRPVDAFIRAAIRQREQTIPQDVLDASSAFNNAARSRYEVGLEIFVQRPNNGGTVNNPNNPNNALRYVRVTGPGLPTAGLVLADAGAAQPQNWMGILNATGANPNDTDSTQQLAGTTSNIFRIQRTQGISGSQAFTLRPNPNVGAANPTFFDWAHPAMYGEAPDANWQFDLSRVPAWSLYTFEAYCGVGTTPCHTFSTRITTPLVPAPYAATQQWHSFAAPSRAFVQDGALATSSVDIAWTPNVLAERVGSVNAYSYSPQGSVNSASTGVPRGSFSRTVTAVNGEFPPLSVGDNTRGRTLQLRHVMLDGSYKDHLIQFN